MFVQIYLKEYTKSKATDADTSIQLPGASTYGAIILEECSKDKITTHNYLVPAGYKWWETQHWIWRDSHHTYYSGVW
jgi:hypothetical protein